MEESKISWRKCVLLAWSKGTVELAKYIAEKTETKYDDVAHILQEEGLFKALDKVSEITPNKIDDVAMPILDKIMLQLMEEK